MAKREQAAGLIRSRITGHGDVEVKDLLANPLNFRRHPGSQMNALRGSMKELGWLKTILINKNTGHILDGHARVEEAMRQGLLTIPATIVDLTEAEEKLALAVLDPITEMANKDDAILKDLLSQVETEDVGLRALLDSLDPTVTDPAEHWVDMPEFEQEDERSFRKLIVHFENAEDAASFFRIIGQEVTDKTKTIWFPAHERNKLKDLEYAGEPAAQGGEGEGGQGDD